jgi:peptide/nickel transport system ATP-binding protein
VSNLLEVRRLTVELPTPNGWVRPMNEVSLRIAAGESLGLVSESGSSPVVAQTATRIAVMRAGKFVEVGAAEQVLHEPNDACTRELLAAVPALPVR